MTDSPRFWTGCAAACMIVALTLLLALGEDTPVFPVLLLGAVLAWVGTRKARD